MNRTEHKVKTLYRLQLEAARERKTRREKTSWTKLQRIIESIRSIPRRLLSPRDRSGE